MSNDDIERPVAGGNILRHKPRESEFTAPTAHAVHCEDIEAHVAKHLAPVDSVFHEILSDLIHLDVLWVKASADRPYHLLITSGMSDLPMTVPEGCEELRHAELFMALPADWNVEGNSDEDYWPMRWLKQVGRLPHALQLYQPPAESQGAPDGGSGIHRLHGRPREWHPHTEECHDTVTGKLFQDTAVILNDLRHGPEVAVQPLV